MLNNNIGISSSNFSPSFKVSASSQDTNFNPALELTKLAAAETKAQVKVIIANLKGRAGRLKAAGNKDSLVKKINKIIKKGEEKIKKLNVEQKLEKMRKREEEAIHKKEAQKLKMEILERKRKRKFKELEDIKNADKIVGESESETSEVSVDTSLSQLLCADSQLLNVNSDACTTDVCTDVSVNSSVDVTL